MGLRLSFGVGPLRASIPLTSRRRRRRRRRRASRPSQPTWQGTGQAVTPDGKRVLFQCGHKHRSPAAATECAGKRRRQIERGENLHLVTRVLDTPESRRLAAERAEQMAKRQHERAAARREAARRRAERQESARLARTEQKARHEHEQAAAQQEAARRRAERDEARREAARQRAERQESARQARTERTKAARQARTERTDARREAASLLAAQRRARRATRPPMGWPGWGNWTAAAMAVTAVVLSVIAGKDTKGPLAGVAVGLMILSVGVALVCLPVALWRKIQVRRQVRAGQPEP
jgi:hypothetical protein